MDDAAVHFANNQNLWLGTPRTARDTIPVTAGLIYGSPSPSSQDAESPDGLSKAVIRLVGAQLAVVTSAAAGFAILLPDRSWRAGQWTDATTTFTDDTVDAQDIGTADFPLFTSGTNNDGFIVLCRVPFNVLSVDQDTASSAATLDYAFWGRPLTGLASTATGWVTTTALIGMTATGTGEKLIVLNIDPNLMVKMVAGDITLASGTASVVDYYAIRVRATSAPSPTAGAAARLYAGREVIRQTSVAANGVTNLAGGTGKGVRTIRGGVALQGFFGTAAAGNAVYVEYL